MVFPFKILPAALRIIFVSFILFILEILLLRVLEYTLDYLNSILLIGYALLGIGLGGFLCRFFSCSLNQAFVITLAGTWSFLLISLWKILQLPSIGLANMVLAVVFAFPGFYLAKAFSQGQASRVYFYDLLGAGGAVFFLFLAYSYLSTEDIIIFLLLFMPALGLLAVRDCERFKKYFYIVFGIMLFISSLFFLQNRNGTYDLFYLAKEKKGLNDYKSFSRDLYLVKSYDNLVARIEVLRKKQNSNQYIVSYNGNDNDSFYTKIYDKLPHDPRIVTDLIDQPRIFIMGTSAEGIVKVAKLMTGQDKIDGIEINPAIDSLMRHDFYQQSGRAYEGTHFKVGHALPFLKSLSGQYDIITLMNLHSMPNISFFGPPDYMHTQEAYGLYFDHLTNRGFLMFEERPWTVRGEAGVYRLINTVYQSLKQKGYVNPQKHFFIYSWDIAHNEADFQKYTTTTYIGLLVKKGELTDEDRKKLVSWAGDYRMKNVNERTPNRSYVLNYLDGFFSDKEYAGLFASMAKGSLNRDYPRWDLSAVTLNRPYSSQVDVHYRQLNQSLWGIGRICLLFLLLVGWHSSRVSQKFTNLRFLLYQMSIGLSYIFVEILFMNIYQKEFISFPVAFSVTLMTLLVTSALGGRFLSARLNPWLVLFCTVISFAVHISLISGIDHLTGYPFKIGAILAAISYSGFLMGYYFPLGLQRAIESGLKDNTGHYFAFNCLAGAWGVVACLFCSVKYGFIATFILAALGYISGIILLP